MLFAPLGYATIFIFIIVIIDMIDIKTRSMEKYIKPGYQPKGNMDKDAEPQPPVGGSSMQEK